VVAPVGCQTAAVFGRVYQNVAPRAKSAIYRFVINLFNYLCFVTERQVLRHGLILDLLEMLMTYRTLFFQHHVYFLQCDSYAKRGICRRRVSVCVSVCLSHSSIVSKRLNVDHSNNAT